MTINEKPPTATAAPASIFDDLHSSYDQVYSEATIQIDYVRKLSSRLPPGSSVLDIGCASGVPNGVLLERAGLKVTGLDISEKMLDEAKKNIKTGIFMREDVNSFIPEKPFDAIVCTLALLAEPSASSYSLAFKISSWIKPGGFLLFGTIDFNDFPVAPGYPVDPTGLTFYHTFMGTTIRDSTFEAGEWIKVMRRAGLRLEECEQRKFDPRPGEIEPEPQCYFLATKTSRQALLGPYMHPYEHYSMSSARSDACWKALLDRRIVDRTTPVSKSWRVTPEGLDQHCPQGVRTVVMDWILDANPHTDVAAAVKYWVQQNPSLEKLKIIQASPSNQMIDLVNSVSRFLGLGAEHHGAAISSILKSLGLTDNDQGVRIELLPAHLDFTDVTRAMFFDTAANVFQDFWLRHSPSEQQALMRSLFKKRLEISVNELEALRQEEVRSIGFDCISVTVDVKTLG